MKKRKNLIILSSLTLPPIIIFTPFLITSCSKGSNEEIPKSELAELVEEQKITIKINSNIIQPPKEILQEYKSNKTEINKLFILYNETDLNISFELLSNVEYDFEKNTISANFRFINSDNNEFYDKVILLNFNFTNITLNEYYFQTYNEIAKNIRFNSEFNQTRILNLFEIFKTNNELIKNCFIESNEILKNIIGIKYKISIPSQTMLASATNTNYFKIKINIFDESNNEVTPTNVPPFSFVKINNDNLKDTFTIINYEDLSKTSIKNLNPENYYGKLLFRSNDFVQDIKIKINYNFSNKGIIGLIDFSMFKEIHFNSSFFTNQISELIFNPNSKIIGLNDNKFKGNNIKKVNLPNIVEDYSSNCFDSLVIIIGLDSIEGIQKYYNFKTNVLDLRTIETEQELETIFNNIVRTNLRSKKHFDKIFLPKYDINLSSITSISVSCNELYLFNDSTNLLWFDYSFKNWTITKLIIPNSIIRIDLIGSFNQINAISWDQNEVIKQLINHDGSITIDDSKELRYLKASTFSQQTLKLNDSTFVSEMDQFFNAELTELIKRIIFDYTYVSLSNISSQFRSKNIIFSSNVERIAHNFYNSLDKTKVTRENNLGTNVINNGILSLTELYKKNLPNLSNVLVGYEKQIKSIDASNIIEIKSKLFQNLSGWNNISITLSSSISVIGENAFDGSDINIIQENFNPQQIKKYAFRNSTISGDLNWSNLIEVGEYSLSGCRKITSVNFEKLTKLSSYLFYQCTELQIVNLPLIQEIPIYCFYGCSKLSTFDFSKITQINSNAFYNNSSLSGDIVLNKSIILNGSYIFYNCSKITSISNFDLNKYDLSVLWGSSTPINVTYNDFNIENFYENIGYNPETKILDMSTINLNDTRIRNYLTILGSELKKQTSFTFKEVILPNQRDINTIFRNVFSNKMTIEKLSWNSTSKNPLNTLHFLFNGATIKLVDSNFLEGMHTIPSNFFNRTTKVENNELNLLGVSQIGSNSLMFDQSINFINTTSISNIDSNAFNSNSIISLPPNVSISETAFGPNTQLIINNPRYKITREYIFDNFYLEVYDQQSKTLDFSKITSFSVFEKYINIANYLLNGDVETLKLPKIPILSKGLSNLGTIKNIQFSNINQVILLDTFRGTLIENKPKIEKTHILLDLDNFFIK